MHQVCPDRECAAKTGLENGLSGEMGGGTYTYLTLPGTCSYNCISAEWQPNTLIFTDQIKAGTVSTKFLDATVAGMLRTKFELGLFENPYPYTQAEYTAMIRTPASRVVLSQADTESIVLLENRNNVLPIKKGTKNVALLGPQAGRVSVRIQCFLLDPLPSFRLESDARSPVRRLRLPQRLTGGHQPSGWVQCVRQG